MRTESHGELTPGQSTYEDLKAIYQDGGVYFDYIEFSELFLPSGNDNYLYFEMVSGVIQSIRFCARTPSFGDEITVTLPENVTVKDFSEIIPTKSTCDDISQICRQDLDGFLGNYGVRIVIPFTQDTGVNISINKEGIVTSIEYKYLPVRSTD